MTTRTETPLALCATPVLDPTQGLFDAAQRSAFELALERAEQVPGAPCGKVARVAQTIDDGDSNSASGPAQGPAAAAAGAREPIPVSDAAPPAAAPFDTALIRAMALGSDPGQPQRYEFALPGLSLSAQLGSTPHAPWTLRLASRGGEREALRTSLATLRVRLADGAAQVGDIHIDELEN